MQSTRSLRARLLIGNLCALVLILGAAAWGSYSVSKHESEEIFGARLATSARVLDALVAKQVGHATLAQPLVIALPREIELSAGDEGTPFGHPYETKIAFQVWRNDGVLLARSASAPVQPFSPNRAGFNRQQVKGELWQVFVLASENTWIQVAEKNEVRDELMHDLGIAVMTPLIAGAVLLLLVVNLLIVYGLAPLRELAARIQTRAPDALGELEMHAVPREVVPVVRALNDLLGRLKLAFEHERRFTDAAAHELRTPLAALKIHAENLARAQSEAERSQSLARLQLGLERTIKLAEQMLAYSRSQSTAQGEERTPLCLIDLVLDTVHTLEPLRSAHALRVDLAGTDAAERALILGEPTKIRQLLTNLIDNAMRYAPQGSAITVSVCVNAERVRLRVANPGKAIAPELRERVFEPYYRIPGSGSEGSGLGLAIVKEIAAQHDAALTLTAGEGESGVCVEVAFQRLVEQRLATDVAPQPVR